VRDELASISKGLSHELKRRVLRELFTTGNLKFTELQRRMDVGNPSELYYHLKELKGSDLIDQDNENNYRLTDVGRKTARIIFKTERVKPEHSGYVFDVKLWARLNTEDISLTTICERIKESKDFRLEDMGEKFVEFRWPNKLATAFARITKAGEIEIWAKIPLNKMCPKEIPSFEERELQVYQNLACSLPNVLLLLILSNIRKTWKDMAVIIPVETDWRINLG